MNKFWKWMEDKGYGIKGILTVQDLLEDRTGDAVHPTKQMLIGYMLEYLAEHKAPEGQSHLVVMCRYDELEKEIEELGK